MKLYYHPVSTTCRPLLLLIAEAGLSVDLEVVDLFSGHGLAGMLFAAFERGTSEVLLCDRRRPAGFERVLRACLREQSVEIAKKLERRRLAAHTVQVKVRYGDFSTLTRQISASCGARSPNSSRHSVAAAETSNSVP